MKTQRRQLPWCGNQTPTSLPPPAKGRSNPTNTPVIPTSYFILLSFAGSIYLFMLVRCPCPLPDGVLHALLCLKVYSWCIRGEMYSIATYISTPSCSPPTSCLFFLELHHLSLSPDPTLHFNHESLLYSTLQWHLEFSVYLLSAFSTSFSLCFNFLICKNECISSDNMGYLNDYAAMLSRSVMSDS